MDFKALEDEAIARVSAAAIGDVRVAAWPDSPGSLGQPTGSGLILIRFLGLDLSPPKTVDRSYLRQDGTISLEARVFVRNLRSHVGAYPLIRQVHKSLSGWLPQLAEPLSAKHPGCYLVSTDLLAKDSQVWDWGMLFRIEVIASQDFG